VSSHLGINGVPLLVAELIFKPAFVSMMFPLSARNIDRQAYSLARYRQPCPASVP
jgi:hypothetical protein